MSVYYCFIVYCHDLVDEMSFPTVIIIGQYCPCAKQTTIYLKPVTAERVNYEKHILKISQKNCDYFKMLGSNTKN